MAELDELSVARVTVIGRVMDEPRESKYTGGTAGCVRLNVQFISRWEKSGERPKPVYSSIPVCCEYDKGRGTVMRAVHAGAGNRVYIEGKLSTRKTYAPDGAETGGMIVEILAQVFAYL